MGRMGTTEARRVPWRGRGGRTNIGNFAALDAQSGGVVGRSRLGMNALHREEGRWEADVPPAPATRRALRSRLCGSAAVLLSYPVRKG